MTDTEADGLDEREEIAQEAAPFTAVPFARATADQLLRLAGPSQVGLILLGGTLVLSRSPEALRPGAPVMVVVGHAATVGLVVLAGLVVGHLIRGFAAFLHLLAEQSEVTSQLKGHVIALSRRSFGAPTEEGPPTVDRKGAALGEVRRAIREGRWVEARELAGDFANSHPDDPDVDKAREELALASKAAADDLLSRIEAAREVNDPDRVIELRDEVKPLLPSDALRELDRELARWFMMLIQRRLRSGTVRSDVAVLAGKIAASLDDTPEGASLRASLPTLRRAAGLCPRCGEPYPGAANACPACVAGLKPSPPESPSTDIGDHEPSEEP